MDVKRRKMAWAVVWVAIAVVAVLLYPEGESTLLFGFWPSNHFALWFWGLITLLIGMVFGYDLMYNVYPEEERLAEEGLGGAD